MPERAPADPRAFLGRGWAFPVAADGHGAIASAEYEEDIREAIRIILATDPGERVMRPDFGCGIHDLVFAPMNRATLGLFESRVRESITKFEARIEIIDLEILTKEADKGKLEISMDCRIRDTNTQFNLVFPFYLTEGAG